MASDKIILSGMTFYGYHGVNRAERELGQRFVVDLELQVDLSAAARSDELESTVNYVSVFKATKEVVEGQPANLIEAVAERIATTLLDRFPLESVVVRVRKPWAPVKGSVLDWVGVEITRNR